MGVFSSIIGSISSAVNSLRAVRGEKVKRTLEAAMCVLGKMIFSLVGFQGDLALLEKNKTCLGA